MTRPPSLLRVMPRIPAKRVTQDDVDGTAAIDDRGTGDGEITCRDAPLADATAIDQDVHRRRHRRVAAEVRNRVGHQVRPHRKVGGDLETCQPNRAAGLQPARDEIAGVVAAQMGDVGQRWLGLSAQFRAILPSKQMTDRFLFWWRRLPGLRPRDRRLATDSSFRR